MRAACCRGSRVCLPACAPESFAAAVERSGVTPAALGTGYVVFFVYSALIGVLAVVLALMVARRQEEQHDA